MEKGDPGHGRGGSVAPLWPQRIVRAGSEQSHSWEDMMTRNDQSKDNSNLSDEQLKSVSGGATFHYPIRSNGDNPFVQAVQLAEKKALFEGSWCSQPDHA